MDQFFTFIVILIFNLHQDQQAVSDGLGRVNHWRENKYNFWRFYRKFPIWNGGRGDPFGTSFSSNIEFDPPDEGINWMSRAWLFLINYFLIRKNNLKIINLDKNPKFFRWAWRCAVSDHRESRPLRSKSPSSSGSQFKMQSTLCWSDTLGCSFKIYFFFIIFTPFLFGSLINFFIKFSHFFNFPSMIS